MNLNRATIIGRITNAIEMKSLPNGTKVANFSVATNHTYKDSTGKKVEKTSFHNVVSFGKTAEVIAQYFIKGQEIFVEGRLDTSSWEDKDTKKKMYKTEIILERFDFGAKPKNSPAQESNNLPAEDNIDYPEEDVNPEDIPF